MRKNRFHSTVVFFLAELRGSCCIKPCFCWLVADHVCKTAVVITIQWLVIGLVFLIEPSSGSAFVKVEQLTISNPQTPYDTTIFKTKCITWVFLVGGRCRSDPGFLATKQPVGGWSKKSWSSEERPVKWWFNSFFLTFFNLLVVNFIAFHFSRLKKWVIATIGSHQATTASLAMSQLPATSHHLNGKCVCECVISFDWLYFVYRRWRKTNNNSNSNENERSARTSFASPSSFAPTRQQHQFYFFVYFSTI